MSRNKPRGTKRKRAALMMGTGALSLAAFTEPTGQATAPSLDAVTAAPAEDLRKHASELEASTVFKQALIEEEGQRNTVYRDVAGYPTVGVGHKVLPQDNLRVGQRISDNRVMALLDRDLEIAARGVRLLVGDLPLHQHEFDALLDLVFNVGIGGVSEHKSPRLNAAIDRGDYEAIANELEYRRAAGVVARGLKYRSERRANIFMDAVYDDPREEQIAKV